MEHKEKISLSEVPLKSRNRRKLYDKIVKAISALGALIGLFALSWILYVVLIKGLKAYNGAFFTHLPTPPGMEGGGIANALMGTILMTGMAGIASIPLGMLAGIYLAEYGKGDKFAGFVRFLTNTLIGVPSIIVGLFAYTVCVMTMGTFSAIAGAFALSIIMLPVIVRTTEDILNMVPNSLREAGLALGTPHWRVILDIVFRSGKSGLLTGVLLAVARVSGETAPLLFTALNSPYWIKSLKEPVANLPVTIFNYAMSPFSDWQAKAWGASLLIMVGVLILTVVARLVIGHSKIGIRH
jgi:phosphate transport system permease protein